MAIKIILLQCVQWWQCVCIGHKQSYRLLKLLQLLLLLLFQHFSCSLLLPTLIGNMLNVDLFAVVVAGIIKDLRSILYDLDLCLYSPSLSAQKVILENLCILFFLLHYIPFAIFAFLFSIKQIMCFTPAVTFNLCSVYQLLRLDPCGRLVSIFVKSREIFNIQPR